MVRYVPEADLLLAPPLVGSATSQARAFTSETVLSGPIPMCRYRGGTARGAARWRIAGFGEQGVLSIRTAELGGPS
jgi:hypothetical protein